MSRNVKSQSPRRYDSTGRKQSAARTRAAILLAARTLFIGRGYTATTIAAVAAEAGVAVDTVYAAIGKKPALFRALVESAISGTDIEVPAPERDYVLKINSAVTADQKLDLYAAAVTSIQSRLAPLLIVMREGAAADAAVAELWHEVASRRAANMRLLATELRKTGQLRSELSDDVVADIIWSMNAAEYYTLLVGERGWQPEQFEAYLADAWKRLLLT